jgi:hypothetical protein
MDEKQYLEESLETRQSHLDLSEPCLERGGISTNHRGVLAQFLDTKIFKRPVDLCHACHNGECSNPRHLYWGSRKENIQDAKDNGTWKSVWEYKVEKYGLEEACRMNARPGNKHAVGNKGRWTK